MLKFLSLLLGLILSLHSFSQWQWTQMANMPMRTANNAVAEHLSITGQSFLYSFGGIDSTKIHSGIHQRVFEYNVLSNSWLEKQSIPDTLGKIAMGASNVYGKIYLMGGYHVLPNGNEISSNRVHIFNPNLGTFEADGAPIPVPIDDHVQCVYKDSLIFLVTGWSQNTNKVDVQIYNPFLDQWQAGTSVPNSGLYKVFGASGYIIGDTLYYLGGATTGLNFPAQSTMRKGYINPNDPTDITWSTMPSAPGGASYRSACSGTGNEVFWVGGSSVSYNYNGIAYNGSGGVSPENRILHLSSIGNQYQNFNSQPFGVMDLRGIGKFTNNRFMICGGMDSNQVVSNRTFLLENTTLSTIQKNFEEEISIKYLASGIQIDLLKPTYLKVISIEGKTVLEQIHSNTLFIDNQQFSKGTYFLQTENSSRKIIIQ
jgi:N-acetylneuraminic acid mutarotase